MWGGRRGKKERKGGKRQMEGEKVKERWRETCRTGKGGIERQRGGEGSSSQAALYPDRSPLHTNFLVKEEKMALNPEKSFSPGAGLSAGGMSGYKQSFPPQASSLWHTAARLPLTAELSIYSHN